MTQGCGSGQFDGRNLLVHLPRQLHSNVALSQGILMANPTSQRTGYHSRYARNVPASLGALRCLEILLSLKNRFVST